MCGIFFSCRQEEHQPPSTAILHGLQRRGPDGADSVTPTVTLGSTVPRKSCSKVQKQIYFLTFFSTVLSLRGGSIVKQPLRDPESGSILAWNGEAWSIRNRSVRGNDAEYVFNIFLTATTRQSDNADHSLPPKNHGLQGVIDMLSSITGPYAFVFYDAQHHRVFYGRDALGRRSLLIRRYSARSIMLSSICDPTDSQEWMEVEADGIYVLDLAVDIDLSDDVDPVAHIPWVIDHSTSVLTCNLVPHISFLSRDFRS